MRGCGGGRPRRGGRGRSGRAGRAARADGRRARRRRVRARRAGRRRVDAGGPADRRVPVAAPDHQPRRARSSPSTRCRRARRTTRAATRSGAGWRTTSSASTSAIASASSAEVDRRAPPAGGGWEVEIGRRRARSVRRARRRQRPQRGRRAGPSPPTRAPTSSRASSCTRSTSATGRTSRAGACWSSGWATARWTSPPTSRTSPARTLLSVRHGSWVIPKRLLGKPADQVIRPWAAVHVPVAAAPADRADAAQADRRPAARTSGCPRRRAACSSRTRRSPTRSSRASPTGEITPKPGIEALERGGVRFTDGTREDVDAIVWCTGYRVTIPFLDPGARRARPAGRCALYKRILHLDAPDLFFVGLMQSTGSAFPILERQSQLLAEHLTGRWAPPSRARDARRRRAALPPRALRAGATHGRPTMRVDFDALHARARRRDRARARRAGRGAGSQRDPPGDRHGRRRRDRLRARRLRCASAAGRSSGSTSPPTGATDVIACDVTVDGVGGRRRCRRRSSGSAAVDALVNNAGIGGPGERGRRRPTSTCCKMIDVNLLGAWRVTAAAIDALVRVARPGRVRRLADGVPRAAARRRLRRLQARR